MANDNFKGVATLLGSRTASYRTALTFGTLTTALGSVVALILARGLLAAFSGKGLVPPDVLQDPSFPFSVALAAGSTVLLATRLGFPISTTHALIGALVGAGSVAASAGVDTDRLGRLLLPLLTSPFLAVLGASVLYRALRSLRNALGVSRETCVCVGEEIVEVVPGASNPAVLAAVQATTLSLGTEAVCRVRYSGNVLGLSARPALDAAHFLSAGAVSFARGLNDTPKIAALLLVGGTVSPTLAILGVGLAMVAGGFISARRVAETMSHRVTEMNAGQGFSANVVTSVLVIGASSLGLPVSTTHVSCGSLFGIGATTGQAHWPVIRGILMAWLITLPLAGGLGALLMWLLRWLG